MMRSPLSSFAVVFAAAAIGLCAAVHSSHARISDRVPASIRRQAAISEPEGDALRIMLQRRMLEDINVVSEKDRVGIQFGPAAYACDSEQEIILNFEGDGIADSGEKPVMQIIATCEDATGVNAMQPIWIPIGELRARSPSNVDIPVADQQTRFKFTNIGTDWPSRWVLQSVRLADVSISSDELRGIAKKPTIIHW